MVHIKTFNEFNESLGENEWRNAGFNEEEIKYRQLLYDLANLHGLREIVIDIPFKTFQDICKMFNINANMSNYRGKRINFSYYTTGWLDNKMKNGTEDAIILSTPEGNNYGYAGESNVIRDKVPAKFFYEYLDKNYVWRNGEFRSKRNANKSIISSPNDKAIARDAMRQVFQGGLDPIDLNPEEIEAIGRFFHI